MINSGGREFHALDLVASQTAGATTGATKPDAGLVITRSDTADPVIDAEAKTAYRRGITELREELEDADGWAIRTEPHAPAQTCRCGNSMSWARC
jgi:hypothetical protein